MARAAARARHGSYIFQRPGSANWYVKLREGGAVCSGGKRIEKSLGTADRLQAEILAADEIKAHRERLLAARPKIETSWQSRLVPGLHVGPDGGHIAATERELTYYNHNGGFLRSEPNGGPAEQIVGAGPLSVHALAEAFTGPRPKVPTKTGDDAILEAYFDHGGKKKTGLHGHYRREAENTWALFKQLTDNKPLKDCTRDDGRKLVTHFKAEGLKSATIQKKITWLNAAVNLAIDERKEGDPLKLKFNPFSSIAPSDDDEAERVPLDDADIKACKRNLSRLSEADQLLFRLLAATGMRLSEAFQIDDEEPKEKGQRFVIIGKKTKQSKRRVPFPAGVLPYLPKAIKGPLFAADTPDRLAPATLKSLAAAASKRLNKFIRKCGIADPHKVLHSLRHRAQDRMRAAGLVKDQRQAVLGHDKVTVGESYGEGYPVTMLKKWIDVIGF